MKLRVHCNDNCDLKEGDAELAEAVTLSPDYCSEKDDDMLNTTTNTIPYLANAKIKVYSVFQYAIDTTSIDFLLVFR